MATRNVRIIPGSQLTTGAESYYVAPANTRCVVKRLSLTNTTLPAVTVTVHLVPSGGSATDSNMIAKAHAIAGEETWDCVSAEGHVLEAGGSIQALASAATSITIVGSGVEIT
jgi:hypothetical protein